MRPASLNFESKTDENKSSRRLEIWRTPHH